MGAGLAGIVQETFEVTRRHGDDLGATMGRVLFQNLRTCIGEFVCNAYDADASTVRVDYDAAKGTLRIFDDGTGMDRVGIDAFYRLGESAKPRNPISPKGRKRIGKFGIATIALRRLARNYVLETAKDGTLLVVEENISDTDLDSKVLPVTVQKTNRERHGTTLTLHDLRFKQGDGLLEMEDLRRYLERNMPLSKDFSIALNGQAIRPPNIPANAIEYLLDFEGDGISIKGSIYYAGRIPKGHNGIFIRSQGVAVGGNNFDLFGTLMKASVAARIHAMIDVEGVTDLVAYNRETFIEDPRVESIVRYISQVLKEVRQDMDVDLEYEQKRKAKEMLDATLAQVGQKVGELFKQSEYKIIFDEERAGAIAKIDRGMRELYINPRSKALRLRKLRGQEVREGLFQALIHAVALEEQPEQPGTSISQGSYADLAARVHGLVGYRDKAHYFKDLLELAGEAEAPRRMSPHRLYNYADVSRMTTWTNLLVRQMIEANMLTARNDRLLWSEVQGVQERLEGYTPTTVIIDREYPDVEGENTFAVRQARRRVTISQFARLQEQGTFPEYFVNLAGEGGEPFYVVQQEHERNYVAFMGSGWKVDFMNSPELYFDWLEKKKGGGGGREGAQGDGGETLEDGVEGEAPGETLDGDDNSSSAADPVVGVDSLVPSGQPSPTSSEEPDGDDVAISLASSQSLGEPTLSSAADSPAVASLETSSSQAPAPDISSSALPLPAAATVTTSPTVAASGVSSLAHLEVPLSAQSTSAAELARAARGEEAPPAPRGDSRARATHARPLEEIVLIKPADGITPPPLPGRLKEYIDGWYQERDDVLPHFSKDIVPLSELARLWVDPTLNDVDPSVQYTSATRRLRGTRAFTHCVSNLGIPIKGARSAAPHFLDAGAKNAIVELLSNEEMRNRYQCPILAGRVAVAPKREGNGFQGEVAGRKGGGNDSGEYGIHMPPRLEDRLSLTPKNGITPLPLPERLQRYITGWYQDTRTKKILSEFKDGVYIPLLELARLWVDPTAERGVQQTQLDAIVRRMKQTHAYRTNRVDNHGTRISIGGADKETYFAAQHATEIVYELAQHKGYLGPYCAGQQQRQGKVVTVQRESGPEPQPGARRSGRSRILSRVDAIRRGGSRGGETEYAAIVKRFGRGRTGVEGIVQLPDDVAEGIPTRWSGDRPEYVGYVSLNGVYDLFIPLTASPQLRDSFRRELDTKLSGYKSLYEQRVNAGSHPLHSKEYDPTARVHAQAANKIIDHLVKQGHVHFGKEYRTAIKARTGPK